VEPKVLLADEPISMLDVSVRLGVLNLLRSLCDDRNLAVMYITHDIASARYIADEIVVMYAGQVVERSIGTELIDNPQHPYTKLLISSVPDPDKEDAQARITAPTAGNTSFNTAGCRFSPRCAHAMPICASNEPPMVAISDLHGAKCWLHASDEQRTAVSLSTKTTSPQQITEE
jgi:peptide/nickel transport system ATP-binding protein